MLVSYELVFLVCVVWLLYFQTLDCIDFVLFQFLVCFMCCFMFVSCFVCVYCCVIVFVWVFVVVVVLFVVVQSQKQNTNK